jgi:hypothetical protein
MQLDQAIQDLFRKQEGILGEYAAGLRSLCADQKSLVNLLLQERKGMAVIDSGFVASKASPVYQLTNDNTTGTGLFFPFQVWRIDLLGAKRVRIAFSGYFGAPSEPPESAMDGAFGVFSTSPSDVFPLSEFALLGLFNYSSAYGDNLLPKPLSEFFTFYSQTDCSSAKFLYVFFASQNYDANINFGITSAAYFPTYQLIG